MTDDEPMFLIAADAEAARLLFVADLDLRARRQESAKLIAPNLSRVRTHVAKGRAFREAWSYWSRQRFAPAMAPNEVPWRPFVAMFVSELKPLYADDPAMLEAISRICADIVAPKEEADDG